jgi:hypothetical protein
MVCFVEGYMISHQNKNRRFEKNFMERMELLAAKFGNLKKMWYYYDIK